MNKKRLEEFRGFFYADGSVTLHKRRAKGRYVKVDGTKVDHYRNLYTVRIHVGQRIDNLPLLKEFQKEYGGYVYLMRPTATKFSRNMSAQWSVQSLVGCYVLLKSLLQTQFTYRGMDAVRACYEYCDWKLKRGVQVKLTPKDREYVDSLIARLKKAHEFSLKYQGQQAID
jgi:hypothetical protein